MFLISFTKPTFANETNSNEETVSIVIGNKLFETKNKSLKINEQVYIPVREFCNVLNANVKWNSKYETVTITKDWKVLEPEIILKNDIAYTNIENIGNMFALDLYKYKNANVVTIGENLTESQLITSLTNYKNYTKNDLTWLSKIIYAEAKGEPYEAKIAVANVILNRVNNEDFPETIKDVIFDKKNGVQFSPVANGAINNTPTDECVLAALEALNGRDIVKDSLYFFNPKIAKSNWISENCKFVVSINNHDFYY